MAVHIVGISGSPRKASRNTGLLKAISSRIPEGVTFERLDLQDVPFFNEDLSDKPASIQKAFHVMERADALVLACPEYNYSVAPALKNILD